MVGHQNQTRKCLLLWLGVFFWCHDKMRSPQPCFADGIFEHSQDNFQFNPKDVTLWRDQKTSPGGVEKIGKHKMNSSRMPRNVPHHLIFIWLFFYFFPQQALGLEFKHQQQGVQLWGKAVAGLTAGVACGEVRIQEMRSQVVSMLPQVVYYHWQGSCFLYFTLSYLLSLVWPPTFVTIPGCWFPAPFYLTKPTSLGSGGDWSSSMAIGQTILGSQVHTKGPKDREVPESNDVFVEVPTAVPGAPCPLKFLYAKW